MDIDKLTFDLKLILNNISHAILFESADHHIQFVNDSFCSLFHIPVASDLLVGADCSKAAEQSSPLFRNPSDFINRIYHIYKEQVPVFNEEIAFADGTYIYRDYKPIFGDGAIKGHLWMYKNIVEIKHIVEEVKKQKDFYENLLNNIPADIAIFDKDHKYLFTNKIAIANDDTNNWIIGKDDFDYYKHYGKPADLAISRRETFEKAVQSGAAVEYEEVGLDNNGNEIFNLRRFYPIIKEEKIEHVIGYGINITNIRKREITLKKKEKELRFYIDSIDQFLVSVNRDGVIEFANSNWLNLTGMTEEKCYGSVIFDFFQQGKDEFILNFESYSRSRKYQTKDRLLKIMDQKKDPHTLTYYISEQRDDQTNDFKYTIYFNDISSQLKVQNQLKTLANKEKKLNELKSHFMNMVSHELRTPLTVILASAELLQLKEKNKDQDNQGYISLYADRIIYQIDIITQLINDFLFIIKVESGKVPYTPVLMDVRNLINKLINDIYNPWKDGRSIQLIIKGKVRPQVQADESMIRLILTNLMNNAFKYSANRNSPKMWIRFGDKKWSVFILDFGIGITDKDKKRIFNPFVRGENVGDVEGSGLGLMLVKSFMKLIKGGLYIKSVVNKGTVVRVDFPY